jgi:hypothetical protein
MYIRYFGKEITKYTVTYRVDQNRIYAPVQNRLFGDSPAKNTVYTNRKYVWFWPTLVIYGVHMQFWPIL